MSRVKTNFFANLAGSGWTALVGLACTPLYIRFMGMEAYGLIGFYFMLQGVIQILDLGLSPTMNREMARYSVLPGKTGEARDFVRTLEVGYWAIGILIGCVVWYGAPYIASHWIKAGILSPSEVRRAVTIMGALTALQWPLSFYQGGLLGLQRQVLHNGITIATSTLSGGGALLVLWLVSPTVSAFFTWQIAVSLLQAAVTTFALWRCLPGSGHAARFDPGITRNIWGFAAGMSGITITALVLTQLDKVILSKMLTLKTFGYYILAGMVGNGLSGLLIAPMFNTIFPRFSALVAARDEKSLLEMYHGSTQVMAVMILPAAIVIAFFSREIMHLWTGSPEIANNTALIVSILVGGTALNGLMNLPYALQLSYGWTRIGLAINTFFILTLVPAIVLMTNALRRRRRGVRLVGAEWHLHDHRRSADPPTTVEGRGVPVVHERRRHPAGREPYHRGDRPVDLPCLRIALAIPPGFASAAGLRAYHCRCRHVHSGNERFHFPFHPQQETTRGARF